MTITTSLNPRWRLKLAAFLALAGAAAGASSASSAPALAASGGLDPAPDPVSARIETDFLTGMIPHHRSAVAMAQMAMSKATKPDLRAFAQHIVDAQQTEVQKMTTWLRDWYGMDAPSGMLMPMASTDMMDQMMHGAMPDMTQDMDMLAMKSGTDFDVAFLSMMTDHHGMVFAMTTPVFIGGHHADLYRLAADIVIGQGQEIRQMQDWLTAWYGLARAV